VTLLQRLLSLLPRLWTNWITLGGAIVTTVAGCTLVLALAADLIAPAPKPYASAFIFLVAPAIFVVGLLAIPIGLYWERRRKREPTGAWATLQSAFDTAFHDETVRRGVMFVGIATLANIAIMGAAGHKALLFMDSVEFCGTTCHTVMQPEYEAYKRSPHQRVACVDCHIGSGASWAVKSKVSGLRQVWAVTVGSFSRPIPSPVHELRPARDTCEQCHWPAKFHGKRVYFRSHFEADEENTESVTAVLLNVGGVDPKTGDYHGIHWHVSPDTKIEYDALDPAREKIGHVRVVKDGEVTKEFNPSHEEGAVHETRTMDCVDCHNRPTHIYDQNAEDAVDRAFYEGLLDKEIPYLAEAATTLLTDDKQPRDGAAARYREGLASWYADNHDDVELTGEQLDRISKVLAELYYVNIFPEMNVGWDAYPTHIGHRGEQNDVRGCFRCHNDEHESEDGEVISQDCDVCHEVLHEEEAADTLPESLRALMKSEQ
jgi:nitrate/TMAO reductase-like tetraheme cytochrome c subunit